MADFSQTSKRVVLVTGACRGIGRSIVDELVKLDYAIAACDISGLDEMREYFKIHNIVGDAFYMNVTDAVSIENALAAIEKQYSAPDILINNAGITRDNLVLRMSDEEWDQVINTNLTSVFKVSRACIRHMIKSRWGRIVNIASIVGIMGNAGQANYSASKAGVIAFTKTLARELASRNITVNAIAPGFIETNMTQKLTDVQKAKLLEAVPMSRYGSPLDVAKAVRFLISDDANYITGATININGGMLMD